MILRRIIAHFRKQEWTAVALDFVIVVMGVFVGIQVSNWNAGLADQRRAESYLERLTEEMSLNRETLKGRRNSFMSQIENGLFAIGASTAPTDREAAWKIVRSFFQASHAFTITLQRGTYEEIISSGDLALLDNQDLVNALSGFYTFGGFSTIETIPVYRERVRRLIPFHMQQYLQTQCYKVIEPDEHFLLDCPPPDSEEDLIALAIELQSNDDLKGDLLYMLSFADVSADIAGNRLKRAEGVLTILSTQTKSTGG